MLATCGVACSRAPDQDIEIPAALIRVVRHPVAEKLLLTRQRVQQKAESNQRARNVTHAQFSAQIFPDASQSQRRTERDHVTQPAIVYDPIVGVTNFKRGFPRLMRTRGIFADYRWWCGFELSSQVSAADVGAFKTSAAAPPYSLQVAQ